jgi:hypothetical protein
MNEMQHTDLSFYEGDDGLQPNIDNDSRYGEHTSIPAPECSCSEPKRCGTGRSSFGYETHAETREFDLDPLTADCRSGSANCVATRGRQVPPGKGLLP